MTFCYLIAVLALTTLFLLLLPWLVDLLFSRFFKDYSQWFCDFTCRYWIFLAFCTGFALALLLFLCRDTWIVWWAEECKRWILIGFVLLLWLICRLLKWIGHCGLDGLYIRIPKITHWSILASRSLYWIMLALAILLIAIIIWCCRYATQGFLCCRDATQGFVPEWTFCHTVLLVFIVLFVLACLLKYLEARYCKSRDDVRCKRVRYYAWLVIVIMFFLIVAVWRCCDSLIDEDYELAMVGIWWEGGYEGEQGVHLRWSFREPLEFPAGGFDIQRRESGSSAWVTLNSTRIHPVSTWDTGTGVTGDMALPVAVERLHPDSWDQFSDGVTPGETPFSDLIDMLSRAPYDPLYFVEIPEPSEFPIPPANPYDTATPPETYLNGYYAAGTEDEPMRPLAVWTWQPMTAINVAAMFPEVARLVGLYYIDKEADELTEYDYRVVGYWPDRERSYIVLHINGPNTDPLEVPVITRADSPLEVGKIDSEPNVDDDAIALVDDRAVGLHWTPPSLDPDNLVGLIDSINSVVFTTEHKFLDNAAVGTSCPPTTDATGFAPATRMSADGETPEVIPPVTPTPLENEVTGDQYWPDHYFFHRDLEYGCHAYRIRGQDIFGRPSETSPVRIVPVVDITAPPPPALLKATLYQRADRSMPAAIRTQHFPDTEDNNYALIVSWVWTDAISERAADAKEFSIFLHTTDYANFVDINAPPAWRAASSWDAQLGLPIAMADTSVMPDRYSNQSPPVAGRYYERVFTDTDINLAALGLIADDITPVQYGWIGVSTTDHDPYNNAGAVTAPVLVFARDFIPPEPPDPPPTLLGPPAPIDERGNRSLQMGWAANTLYKYALFRMNALDLGSVSPALPADVPACLTAPSCDRSAGDEACEDEHRKFDLRVAASNSPARFTQVSPLPLVPDSGSVSFFDTVDGTISSQHFYAAAAIDAAGNISNLSCASQIVLVEDGMPPRAPVVNKLLGADSELRLSWTVNPESDLAEYTVYRTAFEDRVQSRRRMVEMVRLRADGTAIGIGNTPASVSGTGPYSQLTWGDTSVTPGKRYYYRIDAVDLSSNRSDLSGVVSGSAFDNVPPAPPIWAATPLSFDSVTSNVTLMWQLLPEDSDLQVQIQKREVGTRLWRSAGIWTPIGSTTFEDTDGLRLGKNYEYRLRAMDVAGNKGQWSTPPYPTVDTVP
ncbi:MAG: fibronectin type III domain-containing protein [Gammaproteobacteria bacterium]|nr:fibronectin type III domain-containing protein [Gammaproteobacteria bacterium]